MLKSFTLICSLLVLFACKKKMSREDLETQLKMAMYRGLYQNINNDSSVVKFDVLSVNFFEDKDFYDCEFIVRLRKPGYDTTGSMGAMITKDFKKMNRKY
jgi:hypothetical protein